MMWGSEVRPLTATVLAEPLSAGRKRLTRDEEGSSEPLQRRQLDVFLLHDRRDSAISRDARGADA